MSMEYYVYEIYDEKGVMYIGSGRFGRMYEHEAAATRKVEGNIRKGLLPLTGLSDFHARIYTASVSKTLGYRKVFTSYNESEVRIQETYRIQHTSGLLNIVHNKEVRKPFIPQRYLTNKQRKALHAKKILYIRGTSRRHGV